MYYRNNCISIFTHINVYTNIKIDIVKLQLFKHNLTYIYLF